MRARLLKPGFFETEDIAKLNPMCRLLFAGLWCLADREGRLEDRPRLTSSQIFPYEDDLTVEQVDAWLDDLARLQSDGKPFIIRYASCGKRYIQIVGFAKHQHVHPREIKSVIPAPERPGKPKDTPKASLGLDHSREISGLSPSEAEPSEPSEPSEAASSEKHNPASSKSGPIPVPERRTAPPPLRNGHGKPNGNAVRLSYRPEAKAAVVHMLTSWTEGRLGTADGQIAEALLLTIGGDSEEHLESLASWFRSLTKRGKEPGGIQGWGWFPRVLAEDLKANATEAVNV